MPAGKIPADVERYVKEHKDQGKDESYAWALAWSRYCEKNPGSDHCQQGEYFHGKGPSKEAMILRVAHTFLAGTSKV